VNPNGSDGEMYFQYSLSPTLSFGVNSTASVKVTPNSTVQPLTATLTNLSTATTYYYRTVFSNASNGGAQLGPIVSFTTLPVGGSPSVSFSVQGLFFATQALNTTSDAQAVTITNNGNAPLNMANLAVTGDFALLQGAPTNCPLAGSLAANSSCVVAVSFTPTAAATRTGSLSIVGAAQSAQLKGYGMQPFSQGGSPSEYDGNCSTANEGCALTSAASLLTTLDPTVTPTSLDQSLQGTGYCSDDPCQINWTKLPSSVSPGTLVHLADAPTIVYPAGDSASLACMSPKQHQNTAFAPAAITDYSVCTNPPEDLNSYLTAQIVQQQRVVLLAVHYSVAGGPAGDHFVFITAPKGAGDWHVQDPNSYVFGSHSLGEYLNAFTYFSPSLQRIASITFSTTMAISYASGASGGLSVVACSPVELLVTDPQGQQLGSAGSGNDLNQIASGTYARQYALEDDTGTGTTVGDPAGVKYAVVTSPIDGTYTVTTTGTKFGEYTLSFVATASDGSTQTSSFSGFAAPGSSATYTISYSSTPGVPLVVNQENTGPQLGLSGTSVPFGTQTLGTSSVPQSVGIGSTGTSALMISSISISGPAGGDFGIAGGTTCPVAGGNVGSPSSCGINLTFTPTAVGARNATLTIMDNAPGSPHTVTLSGTGGTVNPSFSGSVQQPLGRDGSGHFVATVTISNTSAVLITSAQINTGGTTLGTTAPTTVPPAITNLAPGASATVTLTFPNTAASPTATTEPLKIAGTYSAGTLSGNWSVTFRSVTLK